MSKFNELHEHLKECVDSDNDSFIGITEGGVEFNMYEWAFGLSVQAKNEHDKLVEALSGLVYMLHLDPEDSESHEFKVASDLLRELGHEI